MFDIHLHLYTFYLLIWHGVSAGTSFSECDQLVFCIIILISSLTLGKSIACTKVFVSFSSVFMSHIVSEVTTICKEETTFVT